ncbi:MAG: hypothetical protein BWK73_33330 [Thiothrix lacustris]|uniref:Uncharacterized protein n=1 Tax=Thiothrix lacustris TaxID=525917 RepID=A0A1Y1QHJ3_9GAMM|nr:MAG: hypothetical protein BWK73_33330 [Thiothrix lacustris]
MTVWAERTLEERNLLNPAFGSVLLWHLAKGYQQEASSNGNSMNIPMVLTFVGLSLVLRGKTRNSLPSIITSSLATWINQNPLLRSAVAKGVDVLRPYVRESLIFGANHTLLTLDSISVVASTTKTRPINKYLRTSSKEVQECAKKAQFVGRWLYQNGDPQTVMAMLGVTA